MRFFLLLSIIASILVLSANAAAVIKKRASPNVQTCINNINDVTNQLNTLQPTIESGGVIDVNSKYNDLKNALDSAQSNCCAINSVVSDADADEFLAALGQAAPKIQSVLSAIATKQDSYNFLTKIVVRTHIHNLDQTTNDLNTCFNIFTPSSKASILQGYYTNMQTAFKSTEAAYGM
ncbi:uncharacterized protein B0P05DRAFT_546890 [Gilbertella persicaria]|uniref:uncharacterized protein n=1 Tax=Gilbertella persicaria TaxID=101096 RepID=UPI002220464C|nr:uncharacterized protein B0P05DRAFT_546890 [Gilbertella persicaria]KAI8075907.1 hypothetical protein B0P05DRAFT_546890 [Gilbertella persicaria]